MEEHAAANIFVVMGVSGSGKTTIGTALAGRIGAVFADADDFHSAANKAKMQAGIPLTDEDRGPWLQALHALLAGWAAAETRGVLACSALKASYRETLRGDIAPEKLAFVWLDGSPAMIAKRLAERKGTYMNPALLSSQIATLEPPAEAVRVVNDRTPEEVVAEIVGKVGWTG